MQEQFVVANITLRPDFSLIIKFVGITDEVHVHPTGQINLVDYSSGKKRKATTFVRDPYRFEGAQTIAYIFDPKSLRATSDFLLVKLVIAKFGAIQDLPNNNFLQIPGLYDFAIITSKIDSSGYQIYQNKQFVITLAESGLSNIQVERLERYAESFRTNRKFEVRQLIEFQNLSVEEQELELEKIESGPILTSLPNSVFEVLFPLGLRAVPILNAKGRRFLVEIKSQDVDDLQLDAIRARFKLKKVRGGAYLSDFSEIDFLDFDSEIY